MNARGPCPARYSRFALARYFANHLFEQFGDTKDHHIMETRDNLMRLLESVALVLREKAAPEEFMPLRGVIACYLDVDGDYMARPFKWLDDIPRLAKEYRDDKTA